MRKVTKFFLRNTDFPSGDFPYLSAGSTRTASTWVAKIFFPPGASHQCMRIATSIRKPKVVKLKADTIRFLNLDVCSTDVAEISYEKQDI